MSENNIIPVLSDKIINCVSLDSSQYMRSSPVTFTINNPCDINYNFNAPICINDINYSYGCLGVTLPLPFDLCNGYHTFNTVNTGCQCTINSIPEAVQEQINTAIASANSTISAAQSVLSALTTEEKLTNALNAVESLATTNEDTINALQSIFNKYFGSAPADPIEQQLDNVLKAADYLAQASSLSVSQITANPLDTTTVQQIAALIYNSSAPEDSAIEYIRDIANFVLNYTGAPSQAITYANTALNIASTAESLAITLSTPAPTTTFTDVNNLLVETYTALAEAEGALNLLSQSLGRSDLTQFSTSIQNALFSLYLFQYSTQAIFDSSSYGTDQQNDILNNVARAIQGAATDAKAALNYSNEQTIISVYNDFNYVLNANGSSVCCQNSSKDSPLMSSLFYQTIYSFQICDLKINISGTIGSQCFTATASFSGLTRLEDLGLTPIKAATQLCIPKNSTFTLWERFSPCFSIVCILPENEYDNVNSPSTFNTTLYSFFGLKTNLTVTKKTAAPLLTQNTDLNCRNSIQTC